jgi:hypothetical protein
MARFIILAAVLLLIVAMAAPTASPVRAKKIVLEIDTPHGPVSGSMVVELKSFRAPWWYPVGGVRSGTVQRAEALHLDLGSDKHLFLLVNDQFHAPIRDLLAPGRLAQDGSFRPGFEPLMVTFPDMRDANSVRRIASDNIASIFGDGYRVRNLSVSDTRDTPRFGVIASEFPELYRQLTRPAIERIGAAGLEEAGRGDLRLIGADALVDNSW